MARNPKRDSMAFLIVFVLILMFPIMTAGYLTNQLGGWWYLGYSFILVTLGTQKSHQLIDDEKKKMPSLQKRNSSPG